MSEYVREIERFVADLRGGTPFLSPRERMYILSLEKRGVPLDVLKNIIRKCFSYVPPPRRYRFSVNMCGKEVEREIRRLKKRPNHKVHWLEIFRRKVEGLGISNYPLPSTEEEAERILREIENDIVKKLWENLDTEKKREILRKYGRYRKDERVYKTLIRREILRMFNIPPLSLYIS